MRVVVTGASGFIGRRFLQVLAAHDVTGLCFSHPRPGLVPLDLRDAAAVQATLAEFGPDAVIHCAARPSVDWCEEHPTDAEEMNLTATVSLADACARLGATLAFISTDYLFDGEAGPYGETDATSPLNVYGRLKLAAEDAIRERADAHLIARTTNVFGYDPQSKNFLMGVLPRVARGETVAVAEDQYGTPTHVTDLCTAVHALLEQGHRGTFHVVGSEQAARLTWARAAAETFGLPPERFVGQVTTQLAQAARRPLRSGLRDEKLRAALGRPLRGVRTGLELMRAEWGGAPPVAEW